MLVEKTFGNGARKVKYAEGPVAGPPLILLHGAGGNWKSHLPLFPHFLYRFHTLLSTCLDTAKQIGQQSLILVGVHMLKISFLL